MFFAGPLCIILYTVDELFKILCSWKYTGGTQKNSAVISHPTWAQHPLSAADLPKFLMRFQKFALRAYCGAAEPVSKMASQQEKAFCVLRFEVARSVITVQCEFCARFKKDAPHKNNVTKWY
jgi:hypothetical protein